jgi:hypothetical protein
VRFGHDRDTAEKVEPVDFGLVWDIGAPTPHLIQSEHRTFLAFYLSEPDPAWDGMRVRTRRIARRAHGAISNLSWDHSRRRRATGQDLLADRFDLPLRTWRSTSRHRLDTAVPRRSVLLTRRKF